MNSAVQRRPNILRVAHYVVHSINAVSSECSYLSLLFLICIKHVCSNFLPQWTLVLSTRLYERCVMRMGAHSLFLYRRASFAEPWKLRYAYDHSESTVHAWRRPLYMLYMYRRRRHDWKCRSDEAWKKGAQTGRWRINRINKIENIKIQIVWRAHMKNEKFYNVYLSRSWPCNKVF